MSEGDHGIVPTKFAVAVPSTLPNGHPSANISSGRGRWGVWRGYDIAGIGGGEFALRLVPRQRAAPFYRRTRTHTHTPKSTVWHNAQVACILIASKKSKCKPQKRTFNSAHRSNELRWRVLSQEIKLKSRQIQLAIKLFQGPFFEKVSTLTRSSEIKWFHVWNRNT